jgi:hypothetical protein
MVQADLRAAFGLHFATPQFVDGRGTENGSSAGTWQEQIKEELARLTFGD